MTEKRYTAGTLIYSKAGLFTLFAWLLWGDFCLVLVDAVVPAVLPLKLKALEAPNWLIGIIMSTVPGILNMTVAPWVSFKSDRLRSRWGRRIPFILLTLPFLSASLIMLGWSEEVAHWLHGNVGILQTVAPATVTIALIGFFMFAFRFFDITKPWIIGAAERNLQGGVAIMADDALAGLAAAGVVWVSLTTLSYAIMG
ncbi:MAG: phosphatidylglycerophosphatase A [Spartobacteria bacterium]